MYLILSFQKKGDFAAHASFSTITFSEATYSSSNRYLALASYVQPLAACGPVEGFVRSSLAFAVV